MKRELTLKVLEALSETAYNISDLVDVFLSSGYGASFGKMNYELLKRRGARDRRWFEAQQKTQLLKRLYAMTYRLEKEGMIIKRRTAKERRLIFSLAPKGKELLVNLRDKRKKATPLLSYAQEKHSNTVIVIFDIPEKERRKRVWLRAALRYLGFRMIQKSVWMGKAKIPKEFLQDLHALKISKFVEIFEAKQLGTIE